MFINIFLLKMNGTNFSSFPAAPNLSKPSSSIKDQLTTNDVESTICFSRQDAQHNKVVLSKAVAVGKVSEVGDLCKVAKLQK